MSTFKNGEKVTKATKLNHIKDQIHKWNNSVEDNESNMNNDGYVSLDDNTYKCLRCKHVFKTINEWQQHYKIHKIRKRYLCDLCRESFRYSWELRQHKINIHNFNSKYYTCNICGKGYTSKKTLNRHLKRHATNGFKCSHCTEGFSTLTQLQNHIDEVHSAFSAYCNICDKYYANKFNYKSHFQAFHDDEYIAQIHTCEICGKIYNTKAYLKKHIRSHVGYHCDICGKFLTTKQSLDHHVQLHLGTTKVKCDECGKHFSTKKTLHTHKRQHTGEKPYQCWVCGKRFVQRSSLVIHTRYHTGERPYKCTICSKAFVNKALLNSHTKNKHNKSSPSVLQTRTHPPQIMQ